MTNQTLYHNLSNNEVRFIKGDAAKDNGERKPRYLRLIFDLLEAKTSTVVYEAASSLCTLTSNPVAIKAAAAKFIELAVNEPDNNVKLIVLERVATLRRKNDSVLDDLVMEILRILSSPDLDVRKKALDIALELVTNRTVEEGMLFHPPTTSTSLTIDSSRAVATERASENNR
jgi:coatomer subunit beta